MAPRDPHLLGFMPLCSPLPSCRGWTSRVTSPTNRTWRKWRDVTSDTGLQKACGFRLGLCPSSPSLPLLPLPIFVVIIIFHTMRTLRQPMERLTERKWGLLPTAPWVSLEVESPTPVASWNDNLMASPQRSWARGTWLHCAQVLDPQKPWENN